MFINDLNTVDEIKEAFEALANNINFMYSIVSDKLDEIEIERLDDDDELDDKLENDEEYQELRKIYETLENLTAYV